MKKRTEDGGQWVGDKEHWSVQSEIRATDDICPQCATARAAANSWKAELTALKESLRAPSAGGEKTAALFMKLTADSGCECEYTNRISHEQWGAIMRALGETE